MNHPLKLFSTQWPLPSRNPRPFQRHATGGHRVLSSEALDNRLEVYGVSPHELRIDDRNFHASMLRSTRHAAMSSSFRKSLGLYRWAGEPQQVERRVFDRTHESSRRLVKRRQPELREKGAPNKSWCERMVLNHGYGAGSLFVPSLQDLLLCTGSTDFWRLGNCIRKERRQRTRKMTNHATRQVDRAYRLLNYNSSTMRRSDVPGFLSEFHLSPHQQRAPTDVIYL